MQSRRFIKKKRKIPVDILIASLIAVTCLFIYQKFSLEQHFKIETIVEIPETPPPPILQYGYNLAEFNIDTLIIKPNQMIGDILLSYGINYNQIAELEKKAKDIFSVRKLRAGKNLNIFKKLGEEKATGVVYEPDPFNYVIYDFKDSVTVKQVEKDYVTCLETASGEVESSLWQAMVDRGLNPFLIYKMEDALAWSVSFHHAQKGDEFKLLYEQKYIDGKPVSIGNLLGAFYKNNHEHHAIYFENENYKGFYDLEGRPTKKAYLKAPVQFSRISSRFSYSRMHPVLKRRRPHLGTDFAADYGRPIRAIANGVVVAASYTKGNGKYIKIKHDNTYQSQYLHMSKFAKGIRNAVHVKQGETIGYVGSTGLATGPHVCLRFWKNGRQVDFLRQNFPPPEPMKDEDLPEFNKIKSDVVSLLNQISVPEREKSDLLADRKILID